MSKAKRHSFYSLNANLAKKIKTNKRCLDNNLFDTRARIIKNETSSQIQRILIPEYCRKVVREAIQIFLPGEPTYYDVNKNYIRYKCIDIKHRNLEEDLRFVSAFVLAREFLKEFDCDAVYFDDGLHMLVYVFKNRYRHKLPKHVQESEWGYKPRLSDLKATQSL